MKSAFIRPECTSLRRRRRAVSRARPPRGRASGRSPRLAVSRRPTRAARPPSRRRRRSPRRRRRRPRRRETQDGAPRRAPRAAPAAAGEPAPTPARGAADGRPWLTITPMIVTPIVAPIWRANCVSAVAEPMRERGDGVLDREDEHLHHRADPDSGDHHVPRRLAVRRVDVHAPEERIPSVSTSGPKTTFQR